MRSIRNPGTIKGRAIFENKDRLLLPGMFGRMRLFGGDFDAILIPDSAISSDQARKIVMTVTSDGSVTTKVVTLGPIVDGLRVDSHRPERRMTGSSLPASSVRARDRRSRPKSVQISSEKLRTQN